MKSPPPNQPKSIFDDPDLFEAGEAANLKVRAQLMNRLVAYVEERGLGQGAAAEHFGTSQPRVSNLLKGQISKFSIDALLNMCASAGIEVEVRFPSAYAGQDWPQVHAALPDEWHRYRVESDGAVMRVYVDGALVFEAEDRQRYAGRHISFFEKQSGGAFDNLVMTEGVPGAPEHRSTFAQEYHLTDP